MRVLILLSVLLLTTQAVSLRVRGIGGAEPKIELIESKAQHKPGDEGDDHGHGGGDYESWVEENVQVLGYDDINDSWVGYMEDTWTGQWLQYGQGGYWSPVDDADIPEWVWELIDDYYGDDDGEGEGEDDDGWDDDGEDGDGEGEGDDDDWWDDDGEDGDGEGEDDEIDLPWEHEHDGYTWYGYNDYVDGEDVLVIDQCDGQYGCTSNYYKDGAWYIKGHVEQGADDVHPFLNDIINGNYNPDDKAGDV